MQGYSKDNQELKPMVYSSAGIKRLHFKKGPDCNCIRIHWHEHMELLRVHEGEMWVNDGINTQKLSAGELYIIPPKAPHKGYTLNCGVDYDVLVFDVRFFYNNSELCNTYLPAIFDGRAKFKTVSSDKETIQCFDKIYENWDSNSLSLMADIYTLIHLLFQNNLVEMQNELSRDNTILEIIKYIEENYAQDITTASLSEHFGYTATHFGRKFKQATGLKPMHYLRIYRMEQAYKLLKKGERNISLIASQCGFSDANYFTRCFKAHFGFTPSQTKK